MDATNDNQAVIYSKKLNEWRKNNRTNEHTQERKPHKAGSTVVGQKMRVVLEEAACSFLAAQPQNYHTKTVLIKSLLDPLALEKELANSFILI